MLLIAIKSVSACSYVSGYEPVNVVQKNENYFLAMFFGSFILFVPIVILYFLRKRRGLWTIITAMTSFILFFSAYFMMALFTMCSDGTPIAAVIIVEFFLMCLLFTIQFSLWISQKKIAIKLQ